MHFHIVFFFSIAPKLPEQALPDSAEAVTWATVPSIKSGIPQGSTAPFWIPLKSSPYLFPTFSPWFNIPGRDFLTSLQKVTES